MMILLIVVSGCSKDNQINSQSDSQNQNNYLDKVQEFKVNYNLSAFDYFKYDEEETMKHNFDIFYNDKDIINYFETPEISCIAQFEYNINMKKYFESYYIVHYVSCLGTSDTVEISLISGEEMVFNVIITTYTDENGMTTEGLTVDSYFFLVEKNKIDGKKFRYQVLHEYKISHN